MRHHKVVESARSGQARIVAVTSYARSQLSELADVTLLLGATEGIQSDFATHVIAQVALLNSLELAVVERRGVDPGVRSTVIDEVFGRIVRPE